MKYVCINATNLHSGGGVQVAVSFIFELSRIGRVAGTSFSVLVSTEVARDLSEIDFDSSVFDRFSVFDTWGLSSLRPSFLKLISGYDLVFTIFGPAYFFGLRQKSLVGFAQPWIIFPDNEIFRALSLRDKLLRRIKFWIQRWFFARSVALIVELEHVKRGVERIRLADANRVYVVPNAISTVYFSPSSWRSVQVVKESGVLSFGFVGRDYPHKNTDFLFKLKRALFSKFGLTVNFYVTFAESEWLGKSNDFRCNVINVGSLSVAQCPSFYLQMDAIVFPSFLECFSATPLEAMVMKRPLFASDRGFVRDVCGEYAKYFDPNDESGAASLVYDSIVNGWLADAQRLDRAHKHVVEFSSARGRAEMYLDIIGKFL